MNDVCSIELLQNAVARGLSADEETALHAHLEHCESCCAQMEQLAGGEAWQQEAAELLSADELDAAVPEPANWSEVDFTVEHLDPSDDPNVLGQLGGYDVLAIVGRGGMGVVLKAFDRELKRLVAIKSLAPHLAHSSVARKRFAREAQAAAAVVNPHVIAIHHVQPTGRLPFLIMPLLTGESLAQRLKARGPLELTEVLRIGMQAAAGLAAAHDQGLVHRDVKPANIFLEKGIERVVITDFGLARAADDVSMTRWGVVAGTPEYMSPEQARGEALDGRSDLFSLGCVLYEMATGVSPFRTDSTMATLRRIVDEQPAAMASLVPELPPWFSHIVERLLSKDPAQRFASASEVSQLLEQCLSHLQQPTSVPLPASLVLHAAGRRSIFTVTRKGVLAMLGTIGMTLLGMVLWQATETPDISGQWTSDEWGTVVLEAKGSGEYDGTFSGSTKGQPAAGDGYAGSGGVTSPAGAGGVMRGSADTIPGTDKGQRAAGASELPGSKDQPTFGKGGSAGRGSSSTIPAGAGGEMAGSADTIPGTDKGQRAAGASELPGSKDQPTFGKGGSAGRGSSSTIPAGAGGEMAGSADTIPGTDKGQRAAGASELPGSKDQPTFGKGGSAGRGSSSTIPAGAGGVMPGSADTIPGMGKSGTLHLTWSRLERRFNGTWGKGAGRSGTMSLRLVDQEIRGGFTTDEDVQLETGTPLVGDLLWKRSVVTVPDGGKVLLRNPKRTSEPTNDSIRETLSQSSQRSVSFRAIMFDIDAELSTEFPVGTMHHLGLKTFGDNYKQLIEEGRMTVVSRPNIRTQIGETSTVQIGMSMVARSPDKGEMMDRIVGETLQMTPREVDGELVLDIQFTSERPLKDVAQPATDVPLQSNTYSFRVPLKKYEGNGVMLGPFALPNRILRCIHLVKVDNDVEHQDASLNAANVSEIEKPLETGTPLVGDLLWKRSEATVPIPDGGNVPLGGPKNANETVKTPFKIAPGEILVEVHGGRGTWKSGDKQNKFGKLLDSMKALKGVTVTISEDGEGDAFTKAVVHKPTPVGGQDAESTKQEELLRTIKIPIDEALRAHQVPNVVWLDANGKQQNGPAAKGTGLDKPLDRQNARAVVEAYVAAALASDVAKAVALAKSTPAEPDGIAEFRKLLKVRRLTIKTVYVNDPANPTRALATSESVKLDAEYKQPNGQRDGFLVFKLSMSETGWFVTDIVFESEESADRMLKKFLEDYPNATGSFSHNAISAPQQATRAAEKSTTIEKSMDCKNASSVVEAWVAAVIAKDVTRASSLAKHHPARADQIEGWGNNWTLRDFSIGTAKTDEQSSPPQALVVSLEKVRVMRPVADQPAASFLVFYLKRIDDVWFITDVCPWTTVEEAIDHFLNGDGDVLKRKVLIPLNREANPKPINIPTQATRVDANPPTGLKPRAEAGKSSTSLPDMKPVIPNMPIQAMRWGEPVNGLRLGAMFEGADNQDVTQFRHGDRANIELYLQNVSDEEIDCAFDPADVCKGQHFRRQDTDKQQPDEILMIRQRGGEIVKPVLLADSEGSSVIYRVAALSTNYQKLRPQETWRLDGHKAATNQTGSPVSVREFVDFNIVEKEVGDEPSRRQLPQEYVLRVGKHTAGISINCFKGGKQFRLECPALDFEVVDNAPKKVRENPVKPHVSDSAKAQPIEQSSLSEKTPDLDEIRRKIRTNIAELEELRAEQLKSGQSTKEVDAGIARMKVRLLEVGFETLPRELSEKTPDLDEIRREIRTNIAELEELRAEQLKSGQSTKEVDAGIARMKVRLLEVGFETLPRELSEKTPDLDEIRREIRTNIAELEELRAEQLKSGQSTNEVDAGIARMKVRLLEVGFETFEQSSHRKNARDVIEAFMAAILAGDREMVNMLTLTKGNPTKLQELGQTVSRRSKPASESADLIDQNQPL